MGCDTGNGGALGVVLASRSSPYPGTARWGELCTMLIGAVPPGMGRGRLWYGFCDE
jgi:hypothetical protein